MSSCITAAASFCGRVVLGAAPLFVDSVVETSFSFQGLNGAAFGALAYQGITLLATDPTLLANKTVISLATAVFGALATKISSFKRYDVITINSVANGILGAVSLYYGHYTFGLSALVVTAIYFAG